MVYNYVSSKQVMFNIYNDLNIKTSDWEPRAPIWMFRAMKMQRIRLANVIAEPYIINFTEYGFKLPDNLSTIVSVKVNDIPYFAVDQYSKLSEDQPKYETNNGFIYFGIESGKCELEYRTLPVTYDRDLNMHFVMVPDNERLLYALQYFVLHNLLVRGMVHPIYKVDHRDPSLRPLELYEMNMKIAKREIGAMNMGERLFLMDAITNFYTERYPEYSYLMKG